MTMKRCFSLLMCLLLLLGAAAPASAYAREAEPKVVRVGWYESTYCYYDQFGERRGIAYEYQRRIAAHTGWEYEYVEDSWPNLFQMLINGELDLLSDVSYTEERAPLMLFPSLPMGAESYYLYIDADNTEISSDNLQSLNGKRVGVNKGSFQLGLLRDWAAKNGLSVQIVELTDDEAFFMTMLSRGEIDALVSMDTFGSEERIVPVCKIGASDYYFAVNNSRPDLLSELNDAMTAIQDEDPYFNQRLFDQYVQLTRTNAFLSAGLENWLAEHGTIRVGYWEDYLPFCASDAQSGALTGALKDWLVHAANCLKNAELHFEAVPYPSTGAALSAMQSGEIDCVFPVNISTYRSEQLGTVTTNPVMKTEMSVLTRADDRPEITAGNPLRVAIDEGNENFETFIREARPAWTIVSCPVVEDCFRAVSSGSADVVLVCNYRLSEYQPLQEKYGLVGLPTGETMDLSFAVEAEVPELYSILNKIVNLSQSEDMGYALVSYMYRNQKVSFMDFLKDNMIGVILVLFAVFSVIIALLLLKLKADRKAHKQQRLLEEAAEIAELKQTVTSLMDNMPGMNFTKDVKTGVYLACNQAFAAYAKKARPEDVIGHTDAELFDAPTAKRFAEDDRLALSLDEPYIFFEDVPDAEGGKRQFKNTRLKYTDVAGRQCVLGVSLDVTADTVRIHRESIATKEDYEKARSNGIIYAHIAQALARGYTDLYYINLDTEQFIEYHTNDETGLLAETRRGWHFFESCHEEAERFVYPEDRQAVQEALDRRNLVEALARNRVFMMTYRLLSESGPSYVRMTISRMKDDDHTIILGVTDVDEEMKQHNAAARLQEEQDSYNRLRALAGEFLCIYLVEPETGRYREFSATAGYDTLSQAKVGGDFFAAVREAAPRVNYPEDLNRFLSSFTRENILSEIEKRGSFTLSYRILMEGRPLYVQLRASLVEEKDGCRLIVGISDIDAQVRQEEQYVQSLARAQIKASVDALTGVKNRHAYLIAEERLNAQIGEGRAPAYAVVILDVNDLKKVNDTLGHEAGDQFLRDACKIICNTFKHSPVFRVGGDEFAVISQGEDYENIEELMRLMRAHNAKALQTGGIVIACGMARHENEASVAQVFDRADNAMYENKSELKNRKATGA